jgi:xylulokinase
VVDEDLRVLGTAFQRYDVDYPKPGWAEQDPRLWEAALSPAISAALDKANANPADVAAIGITGQLDGCVAADRDNQPLTPCLIWLDRRAALPAVEGLAERIRDRCGIVADPGHMAAKIAWLRRNAGSEQPAYFHQPVSYIVGRLTGRAVMDYALASTTMLYELAAADWSRELLEAFEIDARQLPELAQAYAPAGKLTQSGAKLTGLSQGVTVAVGTGDDFSTPLGAGIVQPGHLACVLGTAEVVGALDTELKIDPAGLVETHAYFGDCHFIENPGWYAGGAIEWFIRTHRLDGVAEFDKLASAAPPGSDGVLFLPALSGAMAPEWNPRARACFYGLTAAHGLPHLARAVMEGCAFAMRDVIERLRALEVPLQAIRLLGGGARSSVWARIRADVAQLPVELPAEIDTSPIGAAMLAAVACGSAPDIITAARRRDDVRSIAQPGDGAAYDAAHARYRALFESLKPVFDLAPEDPG